MNTSFDPRKETPSLPDGHYFNSVVVNFTCDGGKCTGNFEVEDGRCWFEISMPDGKTFQAQAQDLVAPAPVVIVLDGAIKYKKGIAPRSAFK